MENKLGAFLKEQRGNMPLRQFASICGVSHSYIDKIEKGRDPRSGKPLSVTVDTLRLISENLGIDYVFLCCLAAGINAEDIMISRKEEKPTQEGELSEKTENIIRLLRSVPSDKQELAYELVAAVLAPLLTQTQAPAETR